MSKIEKALGKYHCSSEELVRFLNGDYEAIPELAEAVHNHMHRKELILQAREAADGYIFSVDCPVSADDIPDEDYAALAEEFEWTCTPGKSYDEVWCDIIDRYFAQRMLKA